ncbi:MAG: glycine--tRNA ligase subunit beta [Nitrospinaceae bacterium]
MPELLLEIGAEEIPSGYIDPALNYMERELKAFFTKNRIGAGSSKTLGTPRRLAVAFQEVAARQEDVVETHYGPSVKAAFDPEGNPTKAALGFARGKGVEVSSLTVETAPRGEVVCARLEKKGGLTETILNAFLPKLIANIPFPKKMRWEEKKIPFARPVHWIVAVFNEKPLDFEFDGIHCGDRSQGHRFLNPHPFRAGNLEEYLRECEKAFLVVDPETRRQRIREQIRTLAAEAGGSVEEDPKLLNEVTHLVEYPVAIRGNFDGQYLELPKELLVTTMKHHQKYFPVTGENGTLLPHFITISNMKPDGGDEIRKGNERVLKARLEDGRFFFEEDRKRQLEDFVEELKGVVFQKKLGTSYEKMTRFTSLAEWLAGKVCPDEIGRVRRTARLCKADLVSQMVYEFPELQGIMGSYYAAHGGEDPEVCLGIREHYRPAFAGDLPPANLAGAMVSIADKLDTILGCIGVGLIPSGSEDPYGLRRHSLGIIQIVLHRGLQFSLYEMVDEGLRLLEDKTKLPAEKIRSHTEDLFSQRFKSLLNDEGYPYDAVDAVLSTGIDSLVDVKAKVQALSDLKKQPHFEPLAIAFRRVVSILNEDAPGEIRPEQLKEPAEKKLYQEFLRIREPVETHAREKEFSRALEKIVEIKSAVDDFFDQVMVMVEDETLRNNRLHLLYGISRLFAQLADFSRIVLKKS